MASLLKPVTNGGIAQLSVSMPFKSVKHYLTPSFSSTLLTLASLQSLHPSMGYAHTHTHARAGMRSGRYHALTRPQTPIGLRVAPTSQLRPASPPPTPVPTFQLFSCCLSTKPRMLSYLTTAATPLGTPTNSGLSLAGRMRPAAGLSGDSSCPPVMEGGTDGEGSTRTAAGINSVCDSSSITSCKFLELSVTFWRRRGQDIKNGFTTIKKTTTTKLSHTLMHQQKLHRKRRQQITKTNRSTASFLGEINTIITSRKKMRKGRRFLDD